MGMSVPERRVIVVGGGAAGMMASIFAGKAGARVTLLERGEKLGKKVYITGKGRCNVTNDCTLDEFLHEVARNPRFLYSALSFFSPQDMMQLLEDAGCPVVVQRGRRVFPATEKASDVTRTLARLMQQSGVEVRYGSRVQALMTETAEDGALHVTGVRLMDGTALSAERVILATGGLSCPLTGSTGDGYRLAESLGHTTTPRMGVLSAIETDCEWCGRLQGLALKNVTLTLKKGKKVLYSDLGEMLFTHFGISGPLVLSASAHIRDMEKYPYRVTIDLKPALSAEQLEARVLRDFAALAGRQASHALDGLLPASMRGQVLAMWGVPPEKRVNQLTRAERRALCTLLKALPVEIKEKGSLAHAVITSGGVDTRQVDPKTMESRLCAGLYFAGEVLDVDAYTGGYNLGLAFATAKAAALHIPVGAEACGGPACAARKTANRKEENT